MKKIKKILILVIILFIVFITGYLEISKGNSNEFDGFEKKGEYYFLKRYNISDLTTGANIILGAEIRIYPHVKSTTDILRRAR